jgi:probable addiction module antidote protein
MTKTITTIWDPASHLSTEEDVAAYLEAALQDGDPQLVAAALGDIARAKGMSQIAREAGLGRESLYKSGLLKKKWRVVRCAANDGGVGSTETRLSSDLRVGCLKLVNVPNCHPEGA